MPKVFVDTDILLCQLDTRDLAKQQACRGIMKSLVKSRSAVISTQVLQEFYVASTAKLKLAPMIVKGIIHGFENLEIVTVNSSLINEAIDISVQHLLSFWDSLIIVAAESAKCQFLYTEDLNAGQVIRNVKVYNPIAVG